MMCKIKDHMIDDSDNDWQQKIANDNGAQAWLDDVEEKMEQERLAQVDLGQALAFDKRYEDRILNKEPWPEDVEEDDE